MQKIRFLQSKIDNPLMHSQKDYAKNKISAIKD